jgi:hypothetical protein
MPDDDIITVTSATQTEAELRTSLGVPDDAPAPESPPPVPDEAALEQEADSPKTDADVSEAARVLRRSRSEKKVLKEIALRKQAEERAERAERALADRDRVIPPAAAPPPSPTPAAGDAAPAAAPPAAPTFKFPTFDEYQVEHPDADYDAYQDARSDARDAWREGQRQAVIAQRSFEAAQAEAKRAVHRRVEEYGAHEKTFIDAHPDYNEVLAKVSLALTDEHGRPYLPPTIKPLQDLLLRAGERGPQVLYYLGQHPDEAQTLLAAPTPADLIAGFTEVKLKATATADTPPVRQPSKPTTDAPAPLSAVSGGAQHTPTLQSLADDGEDADAYIAARLAQERSRRRTG